MRPSVKLPSVSVNPNRRRNPAQRRRKPAGQTFEAVAAAGQRCIDKIEQVEEIEYDELVYRIICDWLMIFVLILGRKTKRFSQILSRRFDEIC